ncbi:energy transducer TonB family protein [Christiangramia sabulilitoris]|uniref:Energy transducer TonB n=1 Tax=Christiangramia sabulilitoris TaxID=2583991 RepID=A0A550I868_9FLAO|nr:energy transducer TonB [Christiangramia sabulilitoris]TRO67161.1 energy transducer TonB [Christiangramia sabulilitoris]
MNFFDKFFDKHKALILTTLSFAVLMLALYNFKLANGNQETAEMLVDLEQYRVEEKKAEEPKKQQETPRRNRRDVQTHQAFNQDKETREADFKNKLDEIFNKNSASQEQADNEDTEGSEGNYALNRKNSEEKKNRSDGDDSAKEASQRSAAYDYSSISFSLKGRRAVQIPNPVYTCDTAGKVVINITVDANGYVVDSSVNKGSSTTTNECLTDRALEYSAGAKFSKLAGRNSQPGTITYHFRS